MQKSRTKIEWTKFFEIHIGWAKNIVTRTYRACMHARTKTTVGWYFYIITANSFSADAILKSIKVIHRFYMHYICHLLLRYYHRYRYRCCRHHHQHCFGSNSALANGFFTIFIISWCFSSEIWNGQNPLAKQKTIRALYFGPAFCVLHRLFGILMNENILSL